MVTQEVVTVAAVVDMVDIKDVEVDIKVTEIILKVAMVEIQAASKVVEATAEAAATVVRKVGVTVVINKAAALVEDNAWKRDKAKVHVVQAKIQFLSVISVMLTSRLSFNCLATKASSL